MRNQSYYHGVSDPDYLHLSSLRRTVEEVAASLPPGAVGIDIGCGWCPWRRLFERRGIEILPADIDPYPDPRFRLIRNGRLPFPDASADFCVSWQVLEHVADRAAYFAELRRVLKPSGRAILTTHGFYRVHAVHDFWRWTAAGLRLELEEHGFAEVSVSARDDNFTAMACLANWTVRPLLGRRGQRLFSLFFNAATCLASRLWRLLGWRIPQAESVLLLAEARRGSVPLPASPPPEPPRPAPGGGPSFSVVVCTRDRAEALRRCLDGLAALEPDGPEAEFIVVDTGSADGTPRMITEWAAGDPIRRRVVEEPRLGINYARNAGWRAARNEVVLYVDDDAVPVPGLLKAYAEAYRVHGADRSAWIAVGGRVLPAFDELPDIPSHLAEDLLPWITWHDYGEETLVLDKPETLSLVGANFSVPRSQLEALGGFPDALPGRDEMFVLESLREKGAIVVYVGAAAVWHHCPPSRLSRAWFLRRFAAEGRSEGGEAVLRGRWGRRALRAAKRIATSLVRLTFELGATKERRFRLRLHLRHNAAVLGGIAHALRTGARKPEAPAPATVRR